ncbi:MAG TPA: GntR family transcriptional regulator [Actinomycetota bacterium]|nr:GntR family transcriptional regulator [Actinomycetota bacterium]
MVIDKEGNGVPVTFRLDPGSGVPTYQQIVRQVEHALRLGYLAPGDQLPTVKDVVAALAINPNTVLKAYRELEHKGLVGGRPGQGTFVERALDVVPLRDQQALRKGLARWLDTAFEAGLDAEGVAALFANALQDRAAAGPAPGPKGDPRGNLPSEQDRAGGAAS